MNLLASHRTISKAIRNLGLRKVSTKYCQIVEPRNRVKRFIYCCFSKYYGEKYEDTIDADETTVELRYCASTNYKKDGVQLLRSSGGKWVSQSIIIRYIYLAVFHAMATPP